MEWIEYQIQVDRQRMDDYVVRLSELPFIQGIEIKDYRLTEDDCQQMFVDLLPDIETPVSEEGQLAFYLPVNQHPEQLKHLWQSLLFDEESELPETLVALEERVTTCFKMTKKRCQQQDWETSWQQYYHSFNVGQSILVYPIWEEPVEKDEYPISIAINPGMAFGSGTHETTSLSMLALERYLKRGDKVLDVGTGSGILAILAAKLGAASVQAVDLDQTALLVARENVQNNQVVVNLQQTDLVATVEGLFDVVVANILAEVICRLIPMIKPLLKEGGYFISSGIIVAKQEEVMIELERSGFTVVETNRDGDWIVIVAKWGN